MAQHVGCLDADFGTGVAVGQLGNRLLQRPQIGPGICRGQFLYGPQRVQRNQLLSQVVAARHVYFQTSKVRYFRKYHGSLTAEILRWFLLANYAWQLGLEGAKWLVGHRRPLRAQRIAAYRRVLESGLRA